MLKVVLVAVVNPLAVAISVYPVPACWMLRLENVACPDVAATVAVPERLTELLGPLG